MKIEFTDNEIGTLIELAYLGNWLVNSTKLSNDRINKYDTLFDKILSMQKSGVEQYEYKEELHDRLNEIIKQFEADILPSIVAKAYADFLYPNELGSIKQIASRKKIRELCEKELRTNGFKNVKIDISEE
ncbi:MAG: hypothetical protein FWE22_00720 [Firmicutes bacterium]|nr:hypothetical protein [Bacillota bacterium]